ncbi:IS1595 family transposase [Roseospira visakhapatnamensis]|uniref:Transposase-like protein n=1 Tax=Roseospira visakhapatnamensis TaxID=390880 RepID=A0A7W6RGG9_9PROT|nr:IS1595 family transposase [Roseospira visakhapatnamensis]MBB4268136.1 transposase-like protein [Roseospira visakhapatnamensis]
MDRDTFLVWLSEIDGLTPEQRAEAARVLDGPSSLESLLDLLEQRVGAERRCPHCETTGAVIRGRANGLRRYHCRGCNKTFNALTGTPLARLRHKELWGAFAEALRAGDTIAESADRCGVAGSTAFRWRHRFLRAAKAEPEKLRGIVEADETSMLDSRKGERKLDRKPRKRGGKAAKRGLSKEQVPILIATDSSGQTFSAILDTVNAETLAEHLEPVILKDALLVSDGHRAYPPCAQALGVTHEVLNQSAGERVRGDLHLQTVNSRHARLKDLLRRHRGIATKYLDSYLTWYHLTVLPQLPSPRSTLACVAGLISPKDPICIPNAN